MYIPRPKRVRKVDPEVILDYVVILLVVMLLLFGAFKLNESQSNHRDSKLMEKEK